MTSLVDLVTYSCYGRVLLSRCMQQNGGDGKKIEVPKEKCDS